MATTNSKFSFAISYGLVGGPLHSKGLRKQMAKAGFNPASLREADIIIAHSAGCWLMPKNAKPKIVLYIGMPLASSKPTETWRKAVKSGYKNNSFKRNLKGSSKNAFYGITQPRRNLNIICSASNSKPAIIKGAASIFVANKHDPWPTGENLVKVVNNHDWAFIGLGGSHDDIWDHPDHYVEVINHYAKLLD